MFEEQAMRKNISFHSEVCSYLLQPFVESDFLDEDDCDTVS